MKKPETPLRVRLSSRGAAVFGVVLIVCAVLVSSCATRPKAPPQSEDGRPDFSVLPPGAGLYLWADPNRAGPLLEGLSASGLSGRDASQILERTSRVLAAFYPASAPARFFFVGRGKYPNVRAGLSMAFSRGWKKVKSPTGSRYWFSKAHNMGVALAPRLAFASDGDPFAAPAPEDPAPAGFEEFRLPCVLTAWLTEPGVKLNGFMAGLGIPLQIPAEEFFIGIIREGEGGDSPGASKEEIWKPVFLIRSASASQTRALMSLFALGRMFSGALAEEGPAALAGQLFSGTPVQNGNDLVITAAPMAAGEISLLLKTFLVYSNEMNRFQN